VAASKITAEQRTESASRNAKASWDATEDRTARTRPAVAASVESRRRKANSPEAVAAQRARKLELLIREADDPAAPLPAEERVRLAVAILVGGTNLSVTANETRPGADGAGRREAGRASRRSVHRTQHLVGQRLGQVGWRPPEPVRPGL